MTFIFRKVPKAELSFFSVLQLCIIALLCTPRLAVLSAAAGSQRPAGLVSLTAANRVAAVGGRTAQRPFKKALVCAVKLVQCCWINKGL